MAKRRKKRTTAARKFMIFMLLVVCAVGLILYLSCNRGGQTAAETAAVELNEVMTSNKGAVPDGSGNFPDWFEIHNRTDTAQDISGYGVTDSYPSAAKWTFPNNTVIEPGGYLVIFCDGSTDGGSTHASFKLSASDTLVLMTVNGTVIDSIQLQAVTSGYTLSRQPGAGTWVEMRPSPGYENTDAGADAFLATLTATANESIGVYINEFMPSNASTLVGPDGSYCDWIELYNTTGGDVDLSGYGISDNSSQPLKYVLPQGTTIPAYGLLLIYCTGRETPDGADKIEAPFALAAYKESVVLATPAGKILDSYDYERAESDISFARMPDGTGAFATTGQPTPGYLNNAAGVQAFLKDSAFGTGDVVISEVMNANYSYLMQADQEYYDWIELHNRTDHAISLAGYALSNNAKNPAKWTFPDVSLDAGEYLVVLASGKNVSDAQKKNNLETNFRLSGDGSVVFLFSPEGELLDKLQIGRGHVDVSYGRTGTDYLYYAQPTPNAANGTGFSGYAEQPKLSLASGCYEGAQTVTVEIPEGCTATYTTDGTVPTASSSAVSGPLTISKTTALRVRAFCGSMEGSDTATASYIIFTGEDTVQNHRHNNIAVMSLVTDPKNLFDPETGIYVVGNAAASAATDQDETPESYVLAGGMNADYATKSNFWRDWERPVHFDLIDESGQSEYSADSIIRIFGAFSRNKEQKGFSLVARSGYGPTRFEHAFFDNRDITSYKSVILRASAQDSTFSRIRDIVITSLLEDGDLGLSPQSDIYVQAYRQLVVYINGNYWGVYNLREKISKHFIASHYGVADPESIDILMGNGNEKCIIAGSNTAWKEYTEMVKWAGSHDLSSQANYDYICSLIDVENFAAYTAAEIVVGNTDSGNIKYWRSSELDNKWRWLYYDFCWAMNRNDDNTDKWTSGYRRDFFSRYFYEGGHGAGGAQNKGTSTVLVRALLQNASFRALFLQKVAILLNDVYTPEKIVARVDECENYIMAEMAYDVDLWESITYKTWQQHCDNIRAYATHYQDYCLKYVQAYFNLSDQDMNTIFGRKTSLTE